MLRAHGRQICFGCKNRIEGNLIRFDICVETSQVAIVLLKLSEIRIIAREKATGGLRVLGDKAAKRLGVVGRSARERGHVEGHEELKVRVRLLCGGVGVRDPGRLPRVGAGVEREGVDAGCAGEGDVGLPVVDGVREGVADHVVGDDVFGRGRIGG